MSKEIKFDDRGLLTKLRAKGIENRKKRDRHFRSLKRSFKYLLDNREFDLIFVAIGQVFRGEK